MSNHEITNKISDKIRKLETLINERKEWIIKAEGIIKGLRLAQEITLNKKNNNV